MRYLGIDFGTKRVGVALSDDSGTLAFPHSVLPNNAELISEVALMAKEQKVKAIIVGESKNLDGTDNALMKPIGVFIKAVHKQAKKPVILEPEIWTSFQAGRRPSRRQSGSRGTGERAENRRENEMLDASAAAIILQSYLDRKA